MIGVINYKNNNYFFFLSFAQYFMELEKILHVICCKNMPLSHTTCCPTHYVRRAIFTSNGKKDIYFATYYINNSYFLIVYNPNRDLKIILSYDPCHD
jgi:hypothetical protein